MQQKMLSMPIEKKIGQLFLIGLPSTELDETSIKLLNHVSPGGFCLFSRNVKEAEQVRKLLDNLREVSEIQPFFSLDQEGGLVDRLRRITTPLPATNLFKNKQDVQKLAEITAELLRILSFNLNFAPVVDVVDEERGKFSNGLYSRAFGKSPNEVIELAGTYLNTLQENGCIGTLKHFPGLGASEIDSHEDLPNVNISSDTLYNIDLKPFKSLFAKNVVHAVMIAHAAFPNVDLQETDQNDKLLPSTLSYNFVTELLRNQLGFDGITISDDLEMGAIINNYGIGEACKMAINAGIDSLAICAGVNSIKTGYESLLRAFENGEISEERIDESITRIAKLKSILSQPLPFELQRIQTLSDEISELNNNIKQNYGG